MGQFTNQQSASPLLQQLLQGIFASGAPQQGMGMGGIPQQQPLSPTEMWQQQARDMTARGIDYQQVPGFMQSLPGYSPGPAQPTVPVVGIGDPQGPGVGMPTVGMPGIADPRGPGQGMPPVGAPHHWPGGIFDQVRRGGQMPMPWNQPLDIGRPPEPPMSSANFQPAASFVNQQQPFQKTMNAMRSFNTGIL